MKTRILILLFLLFTGYCGTAQYVVTNLNDSGPGSFRQAILDCNNNNPSSLYSIYFNIVAAPFPPTALIINLSSPLPTVTANVNIYFYNVAMGAGAKMVISGNYFMPGPGIVFNAGKPASIPSGVFVNFAPTTLTVTNTNDDGPGSLRNAMYHAEICNQSKDNIVFNIPGTAPHKINLLTHLPQINSPMKLDASTQPANGYVGTAPKIELDGTGLPYSMTNSSGVRSSGFAAYGVNVPNYNGNNVEIYGFYIHNFNTGIHLMGDTYKIGAPGKGNVISGNKESAILLGRYYTDWSSGNSAWNTDILNNLIGTTPDGKFAEPNAAGSISSAAISLGGGNIRILNNVISGNNAFAIDNNGESSMAWLDGKSFNNVEIKGNKIGTDIDGQYALPNKGVINFDMYGSNLFLGGPALADRNIISGNSAGPQVYSGKALTFGTTTNFNIENNYIGTDITGSYAIPNDNFGITAYQYFNDYYTTTPPNGTIKNNLIAYNNGAPVASGQYCIITHNSIFNNTGSIAVNATLSAPLITFRSADSITGTSTPNLKIELFEDNGFNSYTQGKDFIGEVMADGLGNWKYTGTIQNPCKVTAIAIDIPNKKTSAFSEGSTYSIGADKTACLNSDTIVFDAKPGYSNYLWSTGEITRTIKVTQPGDYFVEVDNGCIYRDTIKASFVQRPTLNLGKDTTVCYNQSIFLDAGNPGAVYKWNSFTGAQTKTINNFVSSTIIAEVSFGNCKNSDTIVVTVIPNLTLNLGADRTVCANAPVVLTNPNAGSLSLWSDGKTTSVDTITTPGKYWLRASNACFTASDTIQINHTNFNVRLGNDTTLCGSNTLLLNAGNVGASYRWNNNGSYTNQNFTAVSGINFVDVTLGNCTKRDSIIVAVKAYPIVNLGNDTTLCNGQNLTLDAKNPTYNYSWSTGVNSKTISVSTPGAYSVAVSSNGFCTKKDTINVSFVNCQRISGTIYNEVNNDCVKNANEQTYAGKLVIVKNTVNSVNYYATSDFQGNYQLDVPQGTYEVSLQQKPYQTIKCPASKIHTISLTGSGIPPVCNFGATITSITDLAVGLNNLSAVRMNTTQTYMVTYSNIGSTNTSGVVKFIKDPFVVFGTQSIVCQINGDTLTYPFGAMSPEETNTIRVVVMVPVNTTLVGKSLCTQAMVIASSQDNIPLNNSINSCALAQYPVDPNNKLVAPAGPGSAGYVGIGDSILTYTINFQNTGNDTAYTVIVKDTISALLDISTLQKIGSSFPCSLEISKEGIVTFVFDQIMLPDSNVNEPASHGFVQFTIQMKNQIPDGSVIENEASIYFDLADPVLTNKAVVTLNQQLSEQTIQFNALNNVPYDAGIISLNAIASSGLGIDYAVSGPVTLSGGNLVINGVGEVRIRAYQTGNNAFGNAPYVDQVFQIEKANQVIAFDPTPNQFEHEDYTLISTGGNSGLPIVYEVVSGPAVINGNIITYTGIGEVIVRASQQGNENYNDAASVVRTILVTNAQTGILEGGYWNNKLEIYPNPSTGRFMVNILGEEHLSDNSTISIFNSAGVLMDSRKASNNNEYTLPLEKGTYFVSLTISDKHLTRKIVIE